MSYLGQEAAGLLLAAAFSICQNTPCSGPGRLLRRPKGLLMSKGQSRCSQLLLLRQCAHLTSQESGSAFCQQNNNSRGKKKSDKYWSWHRRCRRSAWTTGWERGSPVGSSKLLDELQGAMKLHASRPRLKLLFEQFIISGTQALLGKWNKRSELHLNTGWEQLSRGTRSASIPLITSLTAVKYQLLLSFNSWTV